MTSSGSPTPTSTKPRARVETASSAEPPLILVVDDDDDTLTVIRTALERSGFAVTTAASGEEALAGLAERPPAAAVVDLHMPGIDGVEVCRQLKAGQRPGELLPVLLISGSEVIDERIRGFAAGGDDFMAKPISVFELEARLRGLLVRRAMIADLSRAHARLVELDRKKRELATLVVHDLRNPLSAMVGNLELLTAELGTPSEAARIALGNLGELAHKALSLISTILDVEELEEGQLAADPSEVELGPWLEQLARPYRAAAAGRRLGFALEVPAGLHARLDPHLMTRVFENLLDNAIRYARVRGKLALVVARRGAELVIEVGNDGPAVPEAEVEQIFARFYRRDARRAAARENRGLGLYFCKLAVHAHGGEITVGATEAWPTCFLITLPQPD